jgi:hypothetical protein
LATVAQVMSPAGKGRLTALRTAIENGFGAVSEVLGGMVKIQDADDPEALKAALEQIPKAPAAVTEPQDLANTADLLAKRFEPEPRL